MNKYRIKGICVWMLVMFMLTGCGQAKLPDVIDVTSIVVTDNGEVTSYLVGEFDKEYYSLSELTAMAVSEAAEYNTEHQTGETVPVTVEKAEVLENDSDKVMLIYKYDSTESFMDFDENILFYGTVNEAADAGYDLDVILKNVKDGTLFSKDQLLQEADRYLLITDEKAKIYCPKKVTHVSDGAVYEENGSVDGTQTEEVIYILMKK